MDQVEFGASVARELHPYLMRSHLGELSIERPSGHTGDPQTIGHILANKPQGDGPLGEFIDEWLLGLPTSRALRERRAFAMQSVLESLPAVDGHQDSLEFDHDGRRVAGLAPMSTVM